MDETASTNDDVLALARSGAPEGVVVVADHQRAGRGRLDRSWIAPPGTSLLMSILVRPNIPPGDAHLVTNAVACAAAEACHEVAGVLPRIKWPNDLVLVDADGSAIGKVAGVLAESLVDQHHLEAVVVGVGLNVNWPDVPPELRGTAVALNHVVGHEVDRERLLISLLSRFDGWCTAIEHERGRQQLLDRYGELSDTIGATVRVDLPGESITGVALELTPGGHLLVEADDGVHEVIAGDVVHLRPG